MLGDFSHIYIEEDAKNYQLTKDLLARFPKAEQVFVNNYKNVFNRQRQNWRLQKESLKLIIAKRHKGFVYPGTHVMPDFGHQNFFYNSVILNCLYDCQYCFLQGMYPSANIVVFANLEDYFSATEAELQKGAMYLCISYDTDLLGLERIVPYCREWINFATKHPSLTLEIRTKSANFSAIADLQPTENVILAWTMSPQKIIETIELKTASLAARIKSASAASEAGWQVRICIDPILAVDAWRDIYPEMVREVFGNVKKVKDVSLGAFRINKEQYKKLPRGFEGLEVRGESELVSYPQGVERELVGLVREEVLGWVSYEQVYC